MSKLADFIQGALDLLILRVFALKPQHSWAIGLRQVISPVLLIGLCALTPLAFAAPLAGGVAWVATASAPQDVISGEWTAEFQKGYPDSVRLRLTRSNASGENSAARFGVSLSELQGLTRKQAFGPTTNNVGFRMAREAGTFKFEGTFHGGKGAGSWTLTPSPSFLSGMAARGIDDLTEEQRVTAAIADVRTKTVEDLKSAGFDRPTMDDVFKATIFKITPEYISELKSLGYENLALEELVQARMFKVDAEFVRKVEAMGFRRRPLEELGKIRLFEITPEFLREMRAAGLENLSVEDLVKLKIFKIDAEFIHRARSSGHTPVNVEKLVEMKIFNKAR